MASMPQWRKLHTRICQSLDVNDMPDDFHRLLWSWLPLGLDREGRILDNAALVKARVMPLREDVSLERVQQALDWYAEQGLLMRYSVNGRAYFYVPTFARYQGRRGRESPSVYPAPPGQEQVAEAVVDLVQEQVTEWVNEQVTAQNRIDVEEKRIDIASAKRPHASSGKNVVRKALEEHFVRKTKLPLPPIKTNPQKKAAGTRWWGPLRQIAELTQWDVARGQSLIDAALKRMKGLTISAPQSILNTAIAIVGEEARGESRSPPGMAVGPSSRAKSGGE